MTGAKQDHLCSGGAHASRSYWLAAALLLVGLVAMALLSERLSPETPAQERPLLTFVCCYLLSWCGFALSWRLAIRRARTISLWTLIGVAIAARLIFLPSAPIQSDDYYRYILDGESLARGINPFAQAPAELQISPPDALLGEDPEAAMRVIERVNNPKVPTIYPPLAQLVFAAGATLTPWQFHGIRWILMACDMLTICALLFLLHRSKKPLAWAVLYAWNPLVIKEISNSAHVDALVGLCLILLVAALLAWNRCDTADGRAKRLAWSAVCGVLAAAGILAKLYPALLLPACCVWLGRSTRRLGDVAIFLAATCATVALAYWPFMDVGLSQVTAGLREYSGHWINNAGAFVLFDWLFDDPRRIVAGVTGLIALCACLRLWLGLRRTNEPDNLGADRLIQAMQTILLGWSLFSPAFFPWYLIGLLAISCLRPSGWSVILTGAAGLYYALRYFEYGEFGPAWMGTTRAIEHGLIWLTLMVGCVRQIRARKRMKRKYIAV